MQSNPTLDESVHDAPAVRGEAPRSHGPPLVERMDHALGEASSGIGMVLTDLIRKTLRGGVQKIDEELQVQVAEKVDMTVADRMPAIEDAAQKTAETTARHVADDRVEKFEGEIKGDLQQTEQRATQLIEEQIGFFREKTKSASAKIKDELTSLKDADSALGQLVEQVKQQSTDQLRQQAGEFQQQTAQLVQTIEQLQSHNQALETRIAELEKPRGFKKMFGFMSRKKKEEQS